ncbi:thioredoxin [Croceimicrobium sp.]|uniref:thioredoxin n=1 Tax=Croceimicrobium sp. TaxID=2828340 RepID=UPI003BAABD7A
MASFKELIQSDKPVLIDFHADWCQPCKVLSPIVKQVKHEMGDRVSVLKIDVDRNPELAAKLAIQGVPTLMIYRQGELKWRQSGVLSKEAIIQQLNYFGA